jgi:hypothetical protein
MIGTDAKVALRKHGITDIENQNMFLYAISPGANIDNKAYLIIRDKGNNPISFGSDDFHEIKEDIEIQLYFSISYPNELDKVRNDVIEALKPAGFLYSNGTGMMASPLKDIIYCRLFFSKNSNYAPNEV